MKNTQTIKNYMEQYPNVSLRKLAAALDISYQMLLKKSKEPIMGQPYNPEDVNYDAVQAYLDKKEIVYDTLNWNELNEQPIRKIVTLSKDINDFNIGDKIWLRQNDNPYEIIYKTATHIVIIEEDSTEPRCLSHSTFFFKGASHSPRQSKDVE